MFRIILLNHEKIEPSDLQMMQFGSFDARVKRIRGAVEEGKYWWEDLAVTSKPELQDGWSVKAAALKERPLQTGDMALDSAGKVWMLDHTGWENVSKQMGKVLKGEIDLLVDTIPASAVGSKNEKDRGSDQEKNMPGTHANGVSEEVVMLPPADVGSEPAVSAEEALTTPKKRGRKPGSKNKPKVEAAPARRGRPPGSGKKASSDKAVKAKSTGKVAKAAKAAKAPKKTAKKKGVVGVKAQTQVEKAAFSEILRRAKEQDCTAADIVRAAVYKFLGYKPEA